MCAALRSLAWLAGRLACNKMGPRQPHGVHTHIHYVTDGENSLIHHFICPTRFTGSQERLSSVLCACSGGGGDNGVDNCVNSEGMIACGTPPLKSTRSAQCSLPCPSSSLSTLPPSPFHRPVHCHIQSAAILSCQPVTHLAIDSIKGLNSLLITRSAIQSASQFSFHSATQLVSELVS